MTEMNLHYLLIGPRREKLENTEEEEMKWVANFLGELEAVEYSLFFSVLCNLPWAVQMCEEKRREGHSFLIGCCFSRSP